MIKLFELDGAINNKAKRIDKDMNKLKLYCDSFKNATVVELFKLVDREAELINNDNIGHTTGEHDVLSFGMDSEEHDKAMALAKDKAKANGEYFASIPNTTENELTKARLVSF